MHTTQNAQHNVTRIGANLSKHCPSISGLQLLLLSSLLHSPTRPSFPAIFCCLPSGYLGRLFGFGYAEYSRSVDHLVLNCEPNRAGKQKKRHQHFMVLFGHIQHHELCNTVIHGLQTVVYFFCHPKIVDPKIETSAELKFTQLPKHWFCWG